MKKINSTIAIAALLVLLCGCGGVGNVNSDIPNNTLNDGPVAEVVEITEVPDLIEGNKPEETEFLSYAPYYIDIVDGNSRKAILEAVKHERSEGNNAYPRVEEIKEFYSLDNFKIDGYQLNRIMILDNQITYCFVPNGEELAPSKMFGVGFGRTDSKHFFDIDGYIKYLEEEIEYAKKAIETSEFEEVRQFAANSIAENEARLNSKSLREENIIFDGQVKMPFNDTMVSVGFTDVTSLTEDERYVLLRDLAFRIIESAELVTVE